MNEHQRIFLIQVFRKAKAFLEILAAQQNEEHRLVVAELAKYTQLRKKDEREIADGKVSRIASALDDTKQLIRVADKELERLRASPFIEDSDNQQSNECASSGEDEHKTPLPEHVTEVRVGKDLDTAIAVDCNAGMNPGDIAAKYGLTICDTIETLRKLKRKGKVTWGRISR